MVKADLDNHIASNHPDRLVAEFLCTVRNPPSQHHQKGPDCKERAGVARKGNTARGWDWLCAGPGAHP